MVDGQEKDSLTGPLPTLKEDPEEEMRVSKGGPFLGSLHDLAGSLKDGGGPGGPAPGVGPGAVVPGGALGDDLAHLLQPATK